MGVVQSALRSLRQPEADKGRSRSPRSPLPAHPHPIKDERKTLFSMKKITLVFCLCIWKRPLVPRTKGCRVGTGVADLGLLFNFKALIFSFQLKKKKKKKKSRMQSCYFIRKKISRRDFNSEMPSLSISKTLHFQTLGL